MKLFSWCMTALLWISLGGCSAALAGDQSQLLIQLDRDFSREAQTDRVEAWVKYFADNGIRQMGDGVVLGKDGIRRQMSLPLLES